MFAVAALAVAASLPAVDSIRIESLWGGLGETRAATYKIVRRHERYYRKSAIVPDDAVDRFVAAITATPMERQTALRGLATPEWLTARASEPHNDVFVPVCSPEAKQLLAQHLADPNDAVKVLNQYFSTRWTDDFPSIAIDVTFHDRRTMHVESRSQPALMLPWKVGNAETWNPEIPRAIAALLPSGAEPRLADANLALEYVEQVAMGLRGPIDELEERCVHRDFLAAVEKQFQVVRIYHGSSGSFTAYVRRADFPPNLVLTLVIRDAAKPAAQAKLDLTVRRTAGYVDLVRDYVAKQPEQYFAIWCADGISVKGNDRAVRLSDYSPSSGYVSNARTILPDGRVTADVP